MRTPLRISEPAIGADVGTPGGAPGTAVPMSDQQHEYDLRARLRFETFLSDLSARFVNVPVERVDAEIDAGLQALVEFLDVDRATLTRGFAGGRAPVVLGCYAVPGVPEASRPNVVEAPAPSEPL